VLEKRPHARLQERLTEAVDWAPQLPRVQDVASGFITCIQGEAWEFARKGRKKGAARGKDGAPSTQERFRGGSESSADHESGSSKAVDTSNRTVAYFMKATSQDFKEPDKPQKKRKSVCAATAGPAYKITALADQASGLSSGVDPYGYAYGSGEDAYGYAYGMDD
jgi:hypothetical protein